MAAAVSMVALSEDAQLCAADIQHEMAAKWPDLRVSTADEIGDDLCFRIGLADVILAKMPAPIPWSDLEIVSATSFLWPDATAVLKQHKAHLVIAVKGELHPIPLAGLLTQATGAVLSTLPDALGVYWRGVLVIPRDLFIEFAVDILPKGPPIHIWVDFRVGRKDNNRTFGFTAGMAALGHMELEAPDSPETPGMLRQRFGDLADYVLENGPVIGDGHTVGRDARERIRVKYGDSAFGHEGKVMRLEYERQSPKKPWWKIW
jgi:hypothetical protein